MAQALSTNTFGVAKWIVSADPTAGTHTTISGAIVSASSGDTIFIRPGTYTENPVLKAGVNLVANSADSLTPNVTIVGNCTFTTAGEISCSGISFQTNGNFCISVTGSAASILNLINCYILCSNNTGISYTTSSASAQINIFWCEGNIGTTGISLFSMSSPGLLEIKWTGCKNTGLSTTASTSSSGTVNLFYDYFLFPMVTSGTNTISTAHSLFDCGALNTTALTCNGSNGGGSSFDLYVGGSASAISVGSFFLVSDLSVDSSNTNSITGSGSITYGTIDFINTGHKINVAAQLNWNSGTFTPTLAFGGGSTGITYSTQAGVYSRVGNMVFFSINIVTTSKGSSTGVATIGGLPFTSANNGQSLAYAILYQPNITLLAATGFFGNIGPNSSLISLLFETAPTGGYTQISDTTTSNATTIEIQGSYFV